MQMLSMHFSIETFPPETANATSGVQNDFTHPNTNKRGTYKFGAMGVVKEIRL